LTDLVQIDPELENRLKRKNPDLDRKKSTNPNKNSSISGSKAKINRTASLAPIQTEDFDAKLNGPNQREKSLPVNEERSNGSSRKNKIKVFKTLTQDSNNPNIAESRIDESLESSESDEDDGRYADGKAQFYLKATEAVIAPQLKEICFGSTTFQLPAKISLDSPHKQQLQASQELSQPNLTSTESKQTETKQPTLLPTNLEAVLFPAYLLNIFSQKTKKNLSKIPVKKVINKQKLQEEDDGEEEFYENDEVENSESFIKNSAVKNEVTASKVSDLLLRRKKRNKLDEDHEIYDIEVGQKKSKGSAAKNEGRNGKNQYSKYFSPKKRSAVKEELESIDSPRQKLISLGVDDIVTKNEKTDWAHLSNPPVTTSPKKPKFAAEYTNSDSVNENPPSRKPHPHKNHHFTKDAPTTESSANSSSTHQKDPPLKTLQKSKNSQKSQILQKIVQNPSNYLYNPRVNDEGRSRSFAEEIGKKIDGREREKIGRRSSFGVGRAGSLDGVREVEEICAKEKFGGNGLGGPGEEPGKRYSKLPPVGTSQASSQKNVSHDLP